MASGKGKRKAVVARGRGRKRPPTRSSRGERVMLLVGTRKGAFFVRADRARARWQTDAPHFFGQIVNHVVLDPRDRRTLLCAARPGHLGPTIFRSTDFGASWKEAEQPPAFKKAEAGAAAPAVQHTFFLAPGAPSEPNVWYAGTSPPALFRSEDGGATWRGVDGWNENPLRTTWCPPEDQTPDGSILHSILVDPREPT